MIALSCGVTNRGVRPRLAVVNWSRPMRMLARILAIMTAIVVALPASALPRTQYYCRMMGEVMSSCCCKGHGDGTTAQVQQDEVRHPGCCELVTTSDEAAPATRDAVAKVFPAGLVAVLPISTDIGRSTGAATRLANVARGPPALAGPRYITHCRLLI